MAIGGRGPRRAFARRRKEQGFTQESLAARLEVERSTVVRWEAGKSEPQPGTWPKLAALLSITPETLTRLLAGELDDVVPTPSPPTIPPMSSWIDDSWTTRVDPSMLDSVVPAAILAAISVSTDAHFAETMLATLAGYTARDQLLGPPAVIEHVQRDFAFIIERLATSAGTDRARLRYVAARYAESLGWLHQDAGDLAEARRWSAVALTHVTSDEDRALRAYTLMRASNIATDSGNLDTATNFIEQALSHTEGLSAQQRAVLHRQHAHVHVARALRSEDRRDVTACRDALSRAADSAAQAVADPTDLADYCTPEYVAMESAHCWVTLGRPEQAVALLEQRLASWPAEYRRDLGMGLARLSSAYAGVGAWRQAMEVSVHAATIGADTGSRRTLNQLATTVAVLRAGGRLDIARALTDHVRAASRPRTQPL
ncbi:helix-turn-helix transcriptional regulator [Nocardia takedensis]|uniref:helix-turn-helix transcriptional regulator n=1 Tax=Nocardia takedensis TaxID=259390 RepID=UPI0002ED2921|nr:helix-turn-helix transcriptional regulator [Nocardia takedensis]